MTTSDDLDRRTQLEHRAHAVRSRLFDAVDALDRRRRVVSNVSVDLLDIAVPIALGVSLLLVHAATRRRRLTVTIQFGTPKRRSSWLGGIARATLGAALALGVGRLAVHVAPKLLLRKKSDDVRSLTP
jgi:hypothetical protein